MAAEMSTRERLGPLPTEYDATTMHRALATTCHKRAACLVIVGTNPQGLLLLSVRLTSLIDGRDGDGSDCSQVGRSRLRQDTHQAYLLQQLCQDSNVDFREAVLAEEKVHTIDIQDLYKMLRESMRTWT